MLETSASALQSEVYNAAAKFDTQQLQGLLVTEKIRGPKATGQQT